MCDVYVCICVCVRVCVAFVCLFCFVLMGVGKSIYFCVGCREWMDGYVDWKEGEGRDEDDDGRGSNRHETREGGGSMEGERSAIARKKM